MKEQNVKQEYKTLEFGIEGIGEVQISDEVISSISGLAALEVPGVSCTVGSVANEIAGKLGVRNFGKGIKSAIENDEVTVDMNIVIKYGYNINETCGQIQDKVKQAVESMTELAVKSVNIYISGVSVEKEQ